MKKVVIFGLNDFAELAHFYLTQDNDWKINAVPVAFTVNKEYLKQDTFKDLPVVPFEELEKYYPPEEYALFIPMVGTKMNTIRENLYLEGKARGYKFISYISSKCINFATSIGENCFILEGNVLQPFTTIGNNVILWSSNHIGHGSTIGDNCFISSHVVISGHCSIEKNAWIGVNSTIRDGITIGEGSLIGMGSLIAKNTEEDSFYMGLPAKRQIINDGFVDTPKPFKSAIETY